MLVQVQALKALVLVCQDKVDGAACNGGVGLAIVGDLNLLQAGQQGVGK